MATNVRGEPSPDDYRLIAEGSCDWESWISSEDSLRWINKAGTDRCGYSASECGAMARFPWPVVFKDDHITFELLDHFAGEQRAGNDFAPGKGAEFTFLPAL